MSPNCSSHVRNRRSTFLGFSLYGTQFLCIRSISSSCKRCEIGFCVSSNVKYVLLLFGKDLPPIWLPIPCLRRVSSFLYDLFPFNHFCHIKQHHHELLEALDVVQLQIGVHIQENICMKWLKFKA